LRVFFAKNSSLQAGHGYAKSGAMPTEPTDPPKRPLPPAAERALAEAAPRRAERERKAAEQPKESGGRGGLDPTRYGDWEKDGLASDF
jgi:hypothetical protein